MIVSLDSSFMIYYGSLISNVWPNSAPLRDISLRKRSDLEFDLSRSLKLNVIKPMDTLWLHVFPLMFNSIIWPNSAPLRVIRLQNLSDLD